MMSRTSISLGFVFAVSACGAPATPAAAPEPSTSATAPAASSDPAATPAATDTAAASAAPATSASAASPATPASPAAPITTKLTKAQFDDATQFVFAAYKKKPFEAVFKEMKTRFGEPTTKTPPLFGWYGVDTNGKCFQFYVQKNNGEKWAGTGTLESDAANCSK
jgi:hypothetical protein